MIQFYITETGTYNSEQLVDPSQAFVIDVHNKRLKLMENANYVLEFQKLSDSYKTAIDSSDITGLSQKGAFEMYDDFLSTVTTIDSSVNTIEDKLDGIEEGAEKNVNPDWNATTGDASILNRPSLGTAQEVTTGTDTTPKVWSAAVINEVLAEFDANAVRYKNDFNAETGVITDTDGKTLTTVTEKKGDMYIVSTAGTMLGVELQVGDSIIFKKNVAANTAPVASDITFVQGTVKVVNNDATLAWGSLVKVATVEGVDISVALPANPTDGYGTVVTKDYIDAITNDSSLNVVTGKAVKNYVDDTISKAHTHSNKTILDGITDTSISNWNTAYGWGDHASAGYAQQSYVQDVSTRLATTNTNVANVSTYAANVSTNLSTTNTKVNNVSTYAADVSTNLATFKNDVSTNELAWAAAWNQLFVLNPSLNRPSGTEYPV